jgi:alanine racemase
MEPLTRLVIDLDAIGRNLEEFRRLTHGKKIMIPVKADAYGHGIIPVAVYLQKKHVDYLAVAYSSEGVLLRKAGIKIPVLVFGACEDLNDIIKYDLTATAYSIEQLMALIRLAEKRKKKIRIHLKLDTGMGRIGILPEELPEAAILIKRSSWLDVEGVYTHLSSADKRFDPLNQKQMDLFKRELVALVRSGIDPRLVHTANSAACTNFSGTWQDMIRPGIMLYGCSPDNKPVRKMKLSPVMTLKSRIFHIKKAGKGTAIGYNHTFKTKKPSIIGTMAVGYGDGYDRKLSNRGWVLVNGRKAPVIGRVSMDQTTIDLTDIPDVFIGMDATLIGKENGSEIKVEDLARICGTIPYEITCGLGGRIGRSWVES